MVPVCGARERESTSSTSYMSLYASPLSSVCPLMCVRVCVFVYVRVCTCVFGRAGGACTPSQFISITSLNFGRGHFGLGVRGWERVD